MTGKGCSALEACRRGLVHSWRLYVLLLPALIWLVLFCYVPMYGIVIAFKDYKANMGILGSEWAGFKYFDMFLSEKAFWDVFKNTIVLSLYSLLWGFPAPVLFALMLNQMRSRGYKRVVQTVTYAPHFISVVVLVSMMSVFFAPKTGFVNAMLEALGGSRQMFMTRPEYFRSMYVGSGIWQDLGFGAIIYLAALTGINPELHEAAIMDGASKFKRILYIDIPSIAPTIVIMLIMSIGNIMSVGYEKVYLMQSGMNTKVSEIISTYVYKVGLVNAQYSYSTAVGIFNSLINVALLLLTNCISKKLTDTGLF